MTRAEAARWRAARAGTVVFTNGVFDLLHPGHVDVLTSVASLPPDIVGRFRQPMGFARVPDGPYYVFDRRGHSVHTVDVDDSSVRTLVEIGGEDGRLLDPTAFDVAPDGSFAVSTYDGGDGAPEGEYVLTVQWYKPVRQGNDLVGGPNVLPAKYASPRTSDVRITVAAGENHLKPILLR